MNIWALNGTGSFLISREASVPGIYLITLLVSQGKQYQKFGCLMNNKIKMWKKTVMAFLDNIRAFARRDRPRSNSARIVCVPVEIRTGHIQIQASSITA
jgi:hypothetical protein